MLTALLVLLALQWDASPDPGVIGYRVAFQMHYRFDVPCPDEFDPDRMCPVYTPGAWTEVLVDDATCGTVCVDPLTLPDPATGEVMWFQLVAYRDVCCCESQTAWPPP